MYNYYKEELKMPDKCTGVFFIKCIHKKQGAYYLSEEKCGRNIVKQFFSSHFLKAPKRTICN